MRSPCIRPGKVHQVPCIDLGHYWVKLSWKENGGVGERGGDRICSLLIGLWLGGIHIVIDSWQWFDATVCCVSHLWKLKLKHSSNHIYKYCPLTCSSFPVYYITMWGHIHLENVCSTVVFVINQASYWKRLLCNRSLKLSLKYQDRICQNVYITSSTSQCCSWETERNLQIWSTLDCVQYELECPPR